jgi:hypothetical protein
MALIPYYHMPRRRHVVAAILRNRYLTTHVRFYEDGRRFPCLGADAAERWDDIASRWAFFVLGNGNQETDGLLASSAQSTERHYSLSTELLVLIGPRRGSAQAVCGSAPPHSFSL